MLNSCKEKTLLVILEWESQEDSSLNTGAAMSISRVDSSQSIYLFSDEEVDDEGNLKDLIDDGDLKSGSSSEEEVKSLNRKKRRIIEDDDEIKPSDPKKRRKSKRLAVRNTSKAESEVIQLDQSQRRRLKRPRYEDEYDDESYLPNRQAPAVLQGRIFKELYSGLDVLHPEKIIGRDDETRRILSMIMQPSGGVRPLLLGPAGIGKYSIVKKVAMAMKTMLKSHPLGNRKIYCLDCNELLADSVAENVIEIVGDKLREIIETTARNSKSVPIFYFRNIEKILHLDHVTEYLQSVLKKQYPFIASISEDAKSETVIKAQEILAKYNFYSYPIEESPIDDVQVIVKNHLNRHRLHPNLVFTEEAINLGVRLAVKYEHSQPFPIKGINLIQECANNIMLRQVFSGMEVDKMVITPKEIAEVVSLKTKVPAVDLMDNSVFNQERFEVRLKGRIVGQNHAIKIVSNKVAIHKMKLADPKKPWGVFLFVGPTGVGKTELAKCLAKLLFEDESNLITINGSEYKEDHTVSNLIGSPKGYEGNESGGLLTEPLLKNPHQVVLLDEFEKAHTDVQRLFLQVFDGGPLIDRRGKRVNCSHALFIMTSNVGSEMLSEAASKGGMSPESVIQSLIPLLKKEFSPELVGRFKRGIVPFQPLTKELMPGVAEVKLRSINERLLIEAEIDLSWTPELIQHFVNTDVDLGFGMREFCNMIDDTVINIIKDAIIQSEQRITGKLELTYQSDKEQFFLRLRRR